MLVQMSDGNGLRKLPDRQQQFIWMVREWRHIKMGKRAGRGHDPSGLEGTPKGIILYLPCVPQTGIIYPEMGIGVGARDRDEIDRASG
ncbi:hypothetical protein MPER_07071 [Moniliophthora perniciosa FA553]|nr:hypothetical protein MPER_07071 [Moniliophthora perniciosa FA553]